MRSTSVLLSSTVASHSSGFCSKPGLLVVLFFLCTSVVAQDTSFVQKDSFVTSSSGPLKHISIVDLEKSLTDTASIFNRHTYRNRKWLIGATNLVGYGGTLLVLNETWYKQYARSKMHTFNDSKEWLQVDKLGHGWTAYNTSRASAAMWKWAGLSDKKANLIGGISGVGFLTIIEILDGYSTKWGWSWSDVGANFFGAGLFLGQEYLWQQQRIQYKFSFHKNNYSDPQLEARANDLYGKNFYERMLKDYNAQTYWLSANLKSFLPQSNLPAWLNIAVGYGATGMFGGYENTWTTGEPPVTINRNDIVRKRQFYIAPDIDLTKIKTKSRFLKAALSALNSLKFPAPALMLDSKGKIKVYAVYF